MLPEISGSHSIDTLQWLTIFEGLCYLLVREAVDAVFARGLCILLEDWLLWAEQRAKCIEAEQ